MSASRNHIALIPTYIGAGLGAAAFALIGAVPGVLYGGYMGLAMSHAILGAAADPSIFARVITGGGMVLGVLAALFFFLVAGAFFGTVLGLPLAPLLRRAAQAKDAAPAQTAEPKAQAAHR